MSPIARLDRSRADSDFTKQSQSQERTVPGLGLFLQKALSGRASREVVPSCAIGQKPGRFGFCETEPIPGTDSPGIGFVRANKPLGCRVPLMFKMSTPLGGWSLISATVSYPQGAAGEGLPRYPGIPRSSNTEARIFCFQGTIGRNSFGGATSIKKKTKTQSHASKSIFEARSWAAEPLARKPQLRVRVERSPIGILRNRANPRNGQLQRTYFWRSV